MVRRKGGSTIISYHPPREWKSTSALYLRTRTGHAGASVYWRSLFARSEDPTLVLLCMLWYALYAWDEALENLYMHICWLVSMPIQYLPWSTGELITSTAGIARFGINRRASNARVIHHSCFIASLYVIATKFPKNSFVRAKDAKSRNAGWSCFEGGKPAHVKRM